MTSMLGRVVPDNEWGKLETFPVSRVARVEFRTQELQALCPAVEGVQPDVYEASLWYTAVTHAIESKSLKLWLVTFRERRVFAEHLAEELYDKLAHVQGTADHGVQLVQNVRGGIVTVVRVGTVG